MAHIFPNWSHPKQQNRPTLTGRAIESITLKTNTMKNTIQNLYISNI